MLNRKRPSQSQLMLLRFALLGVGLIAFGTVGYMFVEGWDAWSSLYMTIITVTTVGFGEVRALTPQGQAFTTFLILAGVTTGGLAASGLGTALIANVPGWRQKRMEKLASKMSGHVIICGYGRLGEIVRKELEHAGRTFVIVDNAPEIFEALSLEKVPCILGDATDEEVLRKANVAEATGVIAAVRSDADNVFVTMSARQLNQRCAIVARADNPHTEPKLKMVGANEVVTPYVLGGRRLAQAFLHPGALDLADLAMGGGGSEVLIEEIHLPRELPPACDTLAGMQVGRNFGLIAVAMRHADETEMQFNPRADTPLAPGDVLLVMGERESVDRFTTFLAGGKDERG